jgi:Ca2+-binding EF-hand superfamily protein
LNDLINLRKAFNLLDKNNKGYIKYDINKIYESNFEIKFNFRIVEKYDNLVRDQDTVIINFDQFMEIMSNNIIINRNKFGTDKIQFESGN